MAGSQKSLQNAEFLAVAIESDRYKAKDYYQLDITDRDFALKELGELVSRTNNVKITSSHASNAVAFLDLNGNSFRFLMSNRQRELM